jgi:nucleoside-diphosphate-sugar epimerase
MTILLTGANGFLGKIFHKYLSRNNSIFSLSRNSGNFQFSIENEIPYFDIFFDLVIHTAGKAHSFPKKKSDKLTFFDVNVKGTQNLLHGIERSGRLPKSFIFISSVGVYGVDQGGDINENTPLQAKDPYGLSKIQAEQLVFEWCDRNNVICTILRLPLLVGENPPGNLGEMIKVIQKGYYFNIAGGKAKKSMVLAEDVAKIIIKVSEIGGIYNLTDGYHPNFFELSNAIAKQIDKSNPFNLSFFIAKTIALFGDIVGDKFPLNSNKLKKITADLTFDDTKARQVLGWNPSNVLDYYKK